MHVDETSAAELGLVVGEGGGEGALVVVVTVAGRLVLATNIDDDVAGLKKRRVAGANQAGAGVLGDMLAKHVDGQSLVGVEVAVVGADGEGTAIGFDALRCVFDHCSERC